MLPKRDFMEKVERLRVRYGMPMIVASAARCPDHNEKESATKSRTGPHTTGCAIDITVRGLSAWLLLRLALEEGFTGIGVNQKGGERFLHLDDLPHADGQPRPTVWSY